MAYLQAKVNSSSTWSKQDCSRELTCMELLHYPQKQLGRRGKEGERKNGRPQGFVLRFSPRTVEMVPGTGPPMIAREVLSKVVSGGFPTAWFRHGAAFAT